MLTTAILSVCLFAQGGPLKKATAEKPATEPVAAEAEKKPELKPNDGSC